MNIGKQVQINQTIIRSKPFLTWIIYMLISIRNNFEFKLFRLYNYLMNDKLNKPFGVKLEVYKDGLQGNFSTNTNDMHSRKPPKVILNTLIIHSIMKPKGIPQSHEKAGFLKTMISYDCSSFYNFG